MDRPTLNVSLPVTVGRPPQDGEEATKPFCQHTVNGTNRQVSFPQAIDPTAGTLLAARSIEPAPASHISWDAKSYQEHSSSQACDSDGLVNYLISNRIVPLPLSRVCDLGCGTGQNIKSYQRAFDAKVYGADPSQEMCDLAQSTLTEEPTPIQCRGAENFSFNIAFPLILSTHALHWIARSTMPRALSNIHAQLTDNGVFAAVFSAAKTGLPFDAALQATKIRKKYRTAFCDFMPNQYFYSVTEMKTLLRQAQFHIRTLVINPVDKSFANNEQLLGFVQQWLSEYKYLLKNYPLLAESFLNDVINDYLTRSKQKPGSCVTWKERTFTLVATKTHQG